MVSIGYCRSILLAIVASLSSALFAGGSETLKKADALFEKRGQSVDNIHRAKSLYYKVLKDKSESKDVRRSALEGYSRLAVFEGEVAHEIFGVKDVAKIFRECIDATEYLSPKNFGEMTAEYTYWRAMCIGLWGANASKLDITMHLGRLAELKTLNAHGMEHYRAYDGYGFNRILAGMYVRSKALVAFNLYHPQTSLELINETLKDGCDNYMNYILKAEALDALNQRDKAREFLEHGINELKMKLTKDGAIPMHLLAENEIFLVKMYALLEELS